MNNHWQQPIVASSVKVSNKEISVKSCSSCHQQTAKDWQLSLHAQAMGAGVVGQLKNYLVSQPVHGSIQENSVHIRQPKCLVCHAPLTEQRINHRLLKNEGNELASEAIGCASCHIRNGKVFPSSLTLAQHSNKDKYKNISKSPQLKALKKAKFCASCHQFPESGRKLEGKLLQNTFEEWKNSEFAKQGIACQNCHMPAGRHLWRGIHDKEMVLRGVTIDIDFEPDLSSYLIANLTLTNSGVGHYFPTYVTPRVVLAIYQQDKQGNTIKGSYQETAIGRSVSMDLEHELFDSRLAPSHSARLTYSKNKSNLAVAMTFKVIIEPDHFYSNFYRASLENEPYSVGAVDLQQALQSSEKSPYVLFEQQYYF